MPAFVRYFVVLAGCLHLCGGHFGVMQVIAWANMLADYSAANGLADGVRMTFDGRHPCDRCEAIAKVRQGQDDPPANDRGPRHGPLGAELKPCPIWQTPRLRDPLGEPARRSRPPDPDALLARSGEAPDPPPPRSA